MKINWRYVLGVSTIVGVVGFTVYAIKKSKDQKKIDEESISVDEAREAVEAFRNAEASIAITPVDTKVVAKEFGEWFEGVKDIGELKEESRDEASWTSSFDRHKPKDGDKDVIIVSDDDRLEELVIIEDVHSSNSEDRPEFRYDQCDFDTPLSETMTEEDMILKHEPSSEDARNQFIRMELAEWIPREENYLIMVNLFYFPFNPENEGDWDLKTRIIDYRVQFFGFGSRWAKEVTYADVILHYARLAVYNVDESLRFWVNWFLERNQFELDMPNHIVEDLLESLNNHIYVNDKIGTCGLFGLTPESMNSALRIAERNIDKTVTYEIEFNEFLKSCM